jgi:hypothetical protein
MYLIAPSSSQDLCRSLDIDKRLQDSLIYLREDLGGYGVHMATIPGQNPLRPEENVTGVRGLERPLVRSYL